MFKKMTLVLAFIAAMVSLTAHAADPFPQRPIHMIVGFAAGGPTDQAARIVAEAMGKVLGQPVIVDNRPGANSMIAARALIASKPDGYTISLASNGVLTVAGARYKALPFDVKKDFVPIGSVAGYSHVLVMPKQQSVPDLKALIAKGKSSAHPLTIASVGNVDELTIALFRKLAGISFSIIPYKGQSESLTDLLAGRVDMSFLAPAVAQSLIANGNLHPIAVSGGARLQGLPDVPTMQQAGLPGFKVEIWNALIAPAGTDPSVIAVLGKSLRDALAEPSVQKRLADSGLVAIIDTADALSQKIDSEGAEWKSLAREEGLPLLD